MTLKIVRQRAFDRRRVASAEEIGVHEQRVELIELHALRMAGRKGECLLVSAKYARAESSEKPHHRQIDLPMPAVNGRIDQTGRAVFVDVKVASPEVTMQPCGRLRLTDELRQPREQPVEFAHQAGIDAPGVDRKPKLRFEPLRAVELVPGFVPPDWTAANGR